MEIISMIISTECVYEHTLFMVDQNFSDLWKAKLKVGYIEIYSRLKKMNFYKISFIAVRAKKHYYEIGC